MIELTEAEVEGLEGQTILNSVLDKLKEAARPKPDVLITFKDFYLIKSMAVSGYSKLPLDTSLSKKQIDQKDLAHISLANALISWFNSKGLLKETVRFDCTDDSIQYDTNED